MPSRRPDRARVLVLQHLGVGQVLLTPGAGGDSLFADLPANLDAVQWHGAEERRVPPGATLLATNEAGRIEAFRAGPCAWGIQFHVEASPDTVAEWARVPSYRTVLEASYPDGVGNFLAAIELRRRYLERISAALTERLVTCLSSRAANRARPEPSAGQE